MQESLRGALKPNVRVIRFLSRAAARLPAFEHIERWYNRQRRHSAPGCRSPLAFSCGLLLAFCIREIGGGSRAGTTQRRRGFEGKTKTSAQAGQCSSLRLSSDPDKTQSEHNPQYNKGGVGKSTSATNTALGIAGMLRRAGAPNARVLLIDTDSQGHASLVTTGRKDYSADDSLYTVLMADRQNAAQTLLNCIAQSRWDSDLYVLPASPMLEGAERELMGIAGAPYHLADPLSKIDGQYTAVVIDTRPSLSLMAEMGLIAATDAIVPAEPRYLETVGLMSVIEETNGIMGDVSAGLTLLETSASLLKELERNIQRVHKANKLRPPRLLWTPIGEAATP